MFSNAAHLREHLDGSEKMLAGFLGSRLFAERQSAAGIDDWGAFHGAASGYCIEAALVGTSALSRSLGHIQRIG